jgi:hypothetical protein
VLDNLAVEAMRTSENSVKAKFAESPKGEVRGIRALRSSCILRARNRPPTERGSMAREPERKLEDRTFRCLDEDFLFTGKMEYVGHEIQVPGGGTRIEWRPNQSRANCPHDPFHSIELVEE